jgi:hypothetical protein
MVKRAALMMAIVLVAFPLATFAMGTDKIHDRLAMLYGLPLETAVKLWGMPVDEKDVAGMTVAIWKTQHQAGGTTYHCTVTLTLDQNHVIMDSTVEGSDLTPHSGESCDRFFHKPWFKQEKKEEKKQPY